ncbi:hypothetical protein NXS98_10360 [Fontisphaera persica]|uniref:hypothetical protein n=1 Tax=Fontisphaera persica TaxID=2974023 RepID=UPI0024BF44B5|nr:hypothetical protein [Fontisphaera persica]WCJ58126.1 hypothetical protein NXS98_10360 [Fontisphaera persica]
MTTVPSTPKEGRARFFRQSGWMVSATLLGGVCMFAVHVIYPILGPREYGLFTTLLAMLNVLTIPALGLQTTFAHQTAAAITPEDEARLAGTVRAVLGWALVAWLVFVGVVLAFQGWIQSTWAIHQPLALWIVVLFTLCLLWQPVLFGVLQGRQNFFWLGWALITNGAGRLVTALSLVFLAIWLSPPPTATAALLGALIGIAASVVLAGWRTREVWGRKEHLPFVWGPWLRVVIPLTLGLGAFQFLFSVDVLLVRTFYLEDQTGNYNAAGTIGRGLVMFTAPLAVVMFPKVVRSHALGKRSQVMLVTLASVAALGVLAAAGCTLMAWGMRYVVEHPEFHPAWLPAGVLKALRGSAVSVQVLSSLIPWFVWCMLPLALGNVLLNNLLARKKYGVVPWLLLLITAYFTTLAAGAPPPATDGSYQHFKWVIQILGLYSLLFLAACAWFTFRTRNGAQESLPPDPLAGEAI